MTARAILPLIVIMIGAGADRVNRADNYAGEDAAMSLLSPEDLRDLFGLSAVAVLLVTAFYLAV